MTAITRIKQLFGLSSNESSPNGPNAITEALYELSSENHPTTASLGTPEMVNRGGQFSENLRVVIPVVINGDYDIPDLEFDLPSGFEDESAEFYDFLRSFGINEPEEMEILVGCEIDIEWHDGTPVPTWR